MVRRQPKAFYEEALRQIHQHVDDDDAQRGLRSCASSCYILILRLLFSDHSQHRPILLMGILPSLKSLLAVVHTYYSPLVVNSLLLSVNTGSTSRKWGLLLEWVWHAAFQQPFNMATKDTDLANALAVLKNRKSAVVCDEVVGAEGDAQQLNGIFQADRVVLDRPSCVSQRRRWWKSR